jgi:hypothetical protein
VNDLCAAVLLGSPRCCRVESAICAELPEGIVTLRDGRPLVGGTPGGSRRPARAWPPGASTPVQPNRAVKMATSARVHSGTEATQPPISPAMRCRPGAITETALAAILPPGGPARLSEPVNPVPKPVLTCNLWAGEDETLSRPRNSHKRGHRFHERKSLLTCGAPLRNRTVDLLLTMDTQTGSA